jgi:hypothetical protein
MTIKSRDNNLLGRAEENESQILTDEKGAT